MAYEDDEIVPAYEDDAEGNDLITLDMTEEEAEEAELVKIVGEGNIFRDEDGKIIKWINPQDGKFYNADGIYEDEGKEGSTADTDNVEDGSFESLMASMDLTEVQFGEVKKNVQELTPLEREQVLLTLVNNLASESQPTANLKNEEKLVVDFLRTGKTLADLPELLKTIQPISFDDKEDKDVVFMALKEQFPKKTDAQIQKMIAVYDDEELEREATEYKEEKLKSIKTPEQILQETIQAERAREIQEDEAEISKILSFSKGLKEIDGFKVNREELNEVLNYIIPEKAGEPSEFIKETNTKEGLVRIAYYATLGKALIEKGRQEILAELPDAGNYKNAGGGIKTKSKKDDAVLDKLPENVRQKVLQGEAEVY